jgi:uncharacterized NAD(P)/FAD-binding protein YdhS
LIRLGIDPDQIDEHAFYPRLALGEYFLDQFSALIESAPARGIAIEIAANTAVTDIAADRNGFTLSVEPGNASPVERRFDQVVIATGHQWPEDPEARPGYFNSPWPASALRRIAPGPIAIRGSSLTAIDATFIEREGRALDFRLGPGAEALKLSMMSRKGLLPEADFYHPVPYEPLAICTPEAIERLIEAHCETTLDSAYELFKRELAQADPAYARHVGLDDLALEDFADRYFADRLAADPFDWAIANLDEARGNYDRGHTIAWRYAILRMHEVLALITPHLSEEALHRFNRYLKPVFVDEYATVPHLSIERLLALHRAGALDVVALGDDYRIDTRSGERGAAVVVDGERRHFPVLIDATGQRPLAIEHFPFQTLVDQGVVRDAADGDADGPKGIAVDDLYHPVSDQPIAQRLFCLGIPFILGRHPFIQGITSSHEMGEIVGPELARARAATGRTGWDEDDEERVVE